MNHEDFANEPEDRANETGSAFVYLVVGFVAVVLFVIFVAWRLLK